MKNKILVAMSGGVDSSVVAILLKRLGHEVVGITLQLARSSCGLGACCTGPDLEDVKAMCAQEGFPHHTIPAYDDFKQNVINYTSVSYANGLTPSPCVWCNSTVRFQYLFQAMKKFGCDMLATGHYAYSNKGLLAGSDPNKDQSYFLSMVPRHMFDHILFPLGNMHKSTVRKIARRLGLEVATKKDSQDLCFVKDTYWETLNKINPNIFQPGVIKNLKGETLGHHTGIAQYTIGQRKGLGNLQTGKAMYVVDIFPREKQLLVGSHSDTAAKALILEKVNLLADVYDGMFVWAKVRARSKTQLARIWQNGTVIEFNTPVFESCKGQICVFYQNRRVIGAGMISNVIKTPNLNLIK